MENIDIKESLEQLNISIQAKRDEMIKTADEYGLNHEKTLECSHELDQLLNIYQKERKKA